MSAADLLTLQGNIKRDADGYKEEFQLQYRHFQALVDIFKLQPSKESKELGDLAMFVSQVCKMFPKTTANFAPQVMGLLDAHHQLLEPALRRSLVQALILLRNRNQLSAIELMPLFFKLFKCQDKVLRQLLFRHIIADIKNNNKKHRNEKLNRQLQSFMFGVVGDDDEQAAKKALAVCTELWRRHVWRDARTVNVIANAGYHKSSRVMLAAVKFFLGQDKDDEELEEEEEADAEAGKVKAPTKEEIYKAYNAGTRSSKRKKQAKLKRVMSTIKKAERKEDGKAHESFAALHLLHDPQTFAERLFSRLQAGNERFETRMAMMAVISRVIGVHKLLVLNFYPFLQKYIAPHTRDVTLVLAALVGAAHDLVPPDVMAPVLKQLVDQFVHDRARPEVVTLGIKTTRELCLRCPLIMTEELLQDLAAYKKFRNKEVSSAARGLIGLFRELQPELLAKKDRGRGSDVKAKPASYGAAQVADRVDGADLLEQAIAEGRDSDDDEVRISDSDDDGDMEDIDSDDDGDMEDIDSDDLESLNSEDLEGLEPVSDDGEDDEGEDGSDDEDGEGGEDDDSQGIDTEDAGSDLELDSDDEGEIDEDEQAGSDDDEEGGSEVDSDADEDEEEEEASKGKGKASANKKAGKKGNDKQPVKLEKKADSLAALRQKLAEAKKRKEQKSKAPSEDGGDGVDAADGPKVHIEADRILSEEDFERIRRLKQKRLIEEALTKHGVKSVSKAKRQRLLEAAEEEAEETMELRDRLAVINETKIDPSSLEARKKRGHDKASRMATVLAGREGREKFGSSIGRKKTKLAGFSEREKQRKKAMPMAARIQQLRNRSAQARNKSFKKNFKGHGFFMHPKVGAGSLMDVMDSDDLRRHMSPTYDRKGVLEIVEDDGERHENNNLLQFPVMQLSAPARSQAQELCITAGTWLNRHWQFTLQRSRNHNINMFPAHNHTTRPFSGHVSGLQLPSGSCKPSSTIICQRARSSCQSLAGTTTPSSHVPATSTFALRIPILRHPIRAGIVKALSNDNYGSSSDDEGFSQFYTRRGVSSDIYRPEWSKEVQDYWQDQLNGVIASHLLEMKGKMNVKIPLGMTAEFAKERDNSVMCYKDFERFKRQYPRCITLIQIGEFYECCGIDALIMAQKMQYRITNEAKGVPKAGFPTKTLKTVVRRLNHLNYSVAVVSQRDKDPTKMTSSKNTKERHLYGVSTPANPMYLPAGEDDDDYADVNDNEEFAHQRPIMGASWSRDGLSLYTCWLDLGKIEVTRSLTLDAVLALLSASGAAPPLMLHKSLELPDAQQAKTALVNHMRSDNGDVQTYYQVDAEKGFVAMVQSQVDGISAAGSTTAQQHQFKLVYSNHRLEMRPAPLPRSTVMQLGLERNSGVRSLLSVVLPADSNLLVRTWMRQLLLMPPPPDVALHVAAIVRHIYNTEVYMTQLNADLPGSKVTEALDSRRGDASFLRELHSVIEPVIELLRDLHHKDMCHHLLQYSMWHNKESLDDPRFSSAQALALSLSKAATIIANIVPLQPELGRRSPTPNMSGGDDDDGSDYDEPGGSRSVSTGRGTPGTKTTTSGLSKDQFYRKNEKFLDSVREDKMPAAIKALREAKRELDTELEWHMDVLDRRKPFSEAKSTTWMGKERPSVPSIRAVDDALIGLHVPRAFHEVFKKVFIQHQPVDSKRMKDMYTTEPINKKLFLYLVAAQAARTQAEEIIRKLCEDLQPLIPELLLACRASVVATALQQHAKEAQVRSWRIPTIYHPQLTLGTATGYATSHYSTASRTTSNGVANGNGSPHHHGHSSQSQSQSQLQSPGSDSQYNSIVSSDRMRMELEDFWPFWLDSDQAVKNDLVLDRMVLLTGPNMAGKSTVLRSVASVALLANCGLMVPARRASVPFYDAFLLRNFSGDSPIEGKSSFAMEMREVRTADEQCTERSLVLLDEFGKGTEVNKGTALAGALFRMWCERRFVGMFASHLHKLIRLTEEEGLEAAGLMNYNCLQVTQDAQGRQKPTWKLAAGVSTASLAFEVAESEGIRPALLQLAAFYDEQINAGRYSLNGPAVSAGPQTTSRAPLPAYIASPRTKQPLNNQDPTHQDTHHLSRSSPVEASPTSASASAVEVGRSGGSPEPPSFPVDPPKTLEADALPILQKVVWDLMGLPDDQRVQGFSSASGSVTPGLPVFGVIPARATAPIRHSNREAVYILQWARGDFYAGETMDIASRLKDHRKEPTAKKFPYRGPDTKMIYCVLPEGQDRKTVEYNLINELYAHNFAITNAKDRDIKRRRIQHRMEREE